MGSVSEVEGLEDDKPSSSRLSTQESKGAPFTVEQWLKSLALAPKTKGNIRNVMAVVFNSAMRWGLLDLGINPLTLVRVKGISRRQTEPRNLTPDEIQALIAKLAEPCRTAVVIVALSTGLRCSELFALKWLDFDWDSSQCWCAGLSSMA